MEALKSIEFNELFFVDINFWDICCPSKIFGPFTFLSYLILINFDRFFNRFLNVGTHLKIFNTNKIFIQFFLYLLQRTTEILKTLPALLGFEPTLSSKIDRYSVN